uniref:Putative secreted protein n=1 Tax=Ixodes ricinus TaxID=34613 RepID=A0A6B0TUI3_IXORI
MLLAYASYPVTFAIVLTSCSAITAGPSPFMKNCRFLALGPKPLQFHCHILSSLCLDLAMFTGLDFHCCHDLLHKKA